MPFHPANDFVKVDWFAGLWSFASCAYLTAITFIPIPKENIRFADMISGFLLGTVIATILNYRYGSSVLMKKKDEILADAVKNG